MALASAQKAKKRRLSSGPEKTAIASGGASDVREQVESFALAPGMPREDLQGRQRDMAIQFGAGSLEKLVEHPPHREHGRARVDHRAVHVAFSRLAPGPLGPLEHFDPETLCRQIDGAGQPAYAGANYNDTLVRHRADTLRSEGQLTQARVMLAYVH